MRVVFLHNRVRKYSRAFKLGKTAREKKSLALQAPERRYRPDNQKDLRRYAAENLSRRSFQQIFPRKSNKLSPTRIRAFAVALER